MSEGRPPSSERQRFLARFGQVAEHASWVAEAVWERYPAAARAEEYEGLIDAFGKVIRTASREQRMELLRAHPDLACGVVSSSELTEASRTEQAGAGLDRCSPEEFIEFQSLNVEYKTQFGFPFILAVKGLDRRQILERFRDRIERNPDEEFATAIENVIRIIGFRVADILDSNG